MGLAKLVIADGGAASYLPANSLSATSLAIAMEADVIKLDLVLSKDNQVFVFSSPYLESTTNVSEVFPDRMREDQHYYVMDFTMAELRTLILLDPQKEQTTVLQPHFQLSTLTEQLALLKILETRLNHSVTLAVTLVQPWLHRRANMDLSGAVIRTLQESAFNENEREVMLLSYDVEALKYLAKQSLPSLQMKLKLVQLIDFPDGEEYMVKQWGEYQSYDYSLLFTNSGLRTLSATVAAIALPKEMLVDSDGQLLHTSFLESAQQLGAHIYTFPVEKEPRNRLAFGGTFREELEFLYFTVGVDGIFTDDCKDAHDFLQTRLVQTPIGTNKERAVPSSHDVKPNPLAMEN